MIRTIRPLDRPHPGLERVAKAIPWRPRSEPSLTRAGHARQTRQRCEANLTNTEVRSPAERHVAMSWAQRLKRVFNIDLEVCGRCGGSAMNRYGRSLIIDRI